jgi:hypothetical protein
VRPGNVYPSLTREQLDSMRLRRITSNCAPAQLAQQTAAAHDHQAKHIMLCAGSACQACAQRDSSSAAALWEYLSHRIAQINDLRSEGDEEQPILVTRLECLQVRGCGVAWRGVAWRGVAWRGVAWRGVAWRGVAWRGVAWRGVAWGWGWVWCVCHCCACCAPRRVAVQRP